MLSRLRFLALGCATAVPLALGCGGASGGETEQPCSGEKCDETDEPFQPLCTNVIDNSGRGFLPKLLERDPLIKLVYNTEGECPATVAAIVDKLKAQESDCASFGNTDGLATRMVSEVSELTGSAQGLRAITSKKCGDRPEHGILFSTFGIDPSGRRDPGQVEIITFVPDEDDPESGVFNYYKSLDDRSMTYFGSSQDIVEKGPQGPDPFGDAMGCGHCHNGGGLIMKEMRSPWVHWEPSSLFNDPIAAHSWMGDKTGGANLEEVVVQPGNEAWNRKRVEIMANRVNTQDGGGQGSDLRELLLPLFCPVEVNLHNQRPSSSIPLTMLLANGVHRNNFNGTSFPNLGGVVSAFSFSVQGAGDDYDKIRDRIGQRVGELGNDTALENPFLERSHQDGHYVDELIRRKIIDQQFAQDVLMVDFTRALLSPDRCALINALSGETVNLELDQDGNVDRIRQRLIDKLGEAAGAGDASAEGTLLTHLEASAAGSPVDHAATANGFVEACQARTDVVDLDGNPGTTDDQVSGFLMDAIKYKSLVMKVADGAVSLPGGSGLDHHGPAGHSMFGALEVFEGGSRGLKYTSDNIAVTPGAAPDDPMAIDPSARLDPTTCKLGTGS